MFGSNAIARLWLLAVIDAVLFSCTMGIVVPDLIATYNMKDVTGTASFVMNQSGDVRILLDLSGFLDGVIYNWAIYNNGMLYDRENPCSDSYLGDVHPQGNLTSDQGTLTGTDFTNQYLSNKLELSDSPNAIDGRTLVFEHSTSGDRVCAQIVANAELITAIATIDYPFAGQLIFRQPRDDSSAVTTVYMDVYDIVAPIEAAEYTWQISENQGLNYGMTQEERCTSTFSAIYDPANRGSDGCVNTDPSSCPIGDLNSKFGPVTVETIPNKIPQFFVDTNLPLTGDTSIIGKTLVFGTTQNDEIVCVQIRELQPKKVSVLFSANNVSGEIVFQQESPFDPTVISADVRNLQNLASGYHVHKYPVPLKYYEEDQLSSGESVSGHFNPYAIDTTPPNYPAPASTTNDLYEVGDISGKFGTLADLNDFNATYEDWNMPLFGINSIIGRSVIIHKAVNAERWIYGTIGYPAQEVITLQSVFTSPIVGKIVLRQPANDPLGDTSVWVEVAHADGSDTTIDHNWHIHQTRVTNDYLSTESRCSSTGGHDNPFDVELTNDYAECTPENPGRCELGDLTGKLAPFTVPANAFDGAGKNFWTDTRLPLSGAYSVAGKSIVIHVADRGAPRLACADLIDVPYQKAKAGIWTVGPVTGDISLTQQYETDFTTVDSYIEGLDERAAGWHIHNLPVPYDNNEPCSGTSVQGHYNPFNIDGSPPVGTDDMYEVGDLSGKETSFAGLSEYIERVPDTNLYLYGPRSVVGRSIVIHRDDASGTRWVCATLVPDLPGNSYVVIATATFTLGSQISGTITLTQTHYEDENVGETTILAEFNTEDTDSAELDDTFVVEIKSGDEECTSSGQVYNPYEVDTGDNYDCDLRSQLRCQVGDLVGKHGEVSPSIGRIVYTDVNLPIVGRASVLGHSLLIRSSTDGGEYACATIEPNEDQGISVKYSFPANVEYESYEFRTTLDDALTDVDLWNIVSTRQPYPAEEQEGCQTITFYLIGPNQQDMKEQFERALQDKEDGLGKYSPTDMCADMGNSATTISSSSLHLVLFTTLFTSALYVLHLLH